MAAVTLPVVSSVTANNGSINAPGRRRRVVNFIRKFSIRRQHPSGPSPQRSQHSPSAIVNSDTIDSVQPVVQKSKDAKKLVVKNKPHPQQLRIKGGGGQEPQFEVKNEVKSSASVNVDKQVTCAPGVVQQHTDANRELGEPQGSTALPKPHPLPTAIRSTVGEDQKPLHGVHNKLHRANRTLRSIRLAIPRSELRNSGPTQTGHVAQIPTLSSVSDVRPYLTTTKDEKNDPVVTIPANPDGNQLMSMDARNAGRSTGESNEIEKLRRDLSESHHQVAELRKRCEAQSRDLENSNNFLNTADKSSDSDIIQAIQRMNAEVQQNATYMADYLAEDLEFSAIIANLTKEQSVAMQRASDFIGQVLVRSLGTKTPEEIPMLLQIAFQTYLASALCRTASSWTFEPYNAFIDGVYQRLRRVGEEPSKYPSVLADEEKTTEAQAISGRWRSLARVHIVHNWSTDPGSLVKGIIAGVSDILLAAGCTTIQSDIISKVTSVFEERIALLVELAGRLNKLFDGVISSDFEVFMIRPGEKFENKDMEDPDDDQVGAHEGPVLCATHLGLTKRMPVGTLWERGRKQKVVVLKAKVLLESFLDTKDAS